MFHFCIIVVHSISDLIEKPILRSAVLFYQSGYERTQYSMFWTCKLFVQIRCITGYWCYQNHLALSTQGPIMPSKIIKRKLWFRIRQVFHKRKKVIKKAFIKFRNYFVWMQMDVFQDGWRNTHHNEARFFAKYSELLHVVSLKTKTPGYNTVAASHAQNTRY